MGKNKYYQWSHHFILFKSFGAEWKTKLVYFDTVLKTEAFLPSFGDSLLCEDEPDVELTLPGETKKQHKYCEGYFA